MPVTCGCGAEAFFCHPRVKSLPVWGLVDAAMHQLLYHSMIHRIENLESVKMQREMVAQDDSDQEEVRVRPGEMA
jgi:hypothetical protein